MKVLLLSTAVATFAASGAASAQPFVMSDEQADRVTAGGNSGPPAIIRQPLGSHIEAASAKANTGAYLSSNGNAFSTRVGGDSRIARTPDAPVFGTDVSLR
jgi:hypothetical protein